MIVATVKAKTYRADLRADGACIVRALERQRALRDDVQRQLFDIIPRVSDDPCAGLVVSWQTE